MVQINQHLKRDPVLARTHPENFGKDANRQHWLRKICFPCLEKTHERQAADKYLYQYQNDNMHEPPTIGVMSVISL